MSEPETIDDQTEFVPLAYFANVIEAGMVRQLLENNDITAILQGANFGALDPLPLPGGFSEITLLVPRSEFERAQDLYQAFFESEVEIPEDQENQTDE